MSRSSWKNPLIKPQSVSLLSEKIVGRNTSILPFHVDKNFLVHNGNTFLHVTVLSGMVGKKFGEFSLTRKPFNFKKKK